MHNPLKRPILAILEKTQVPLKEYELHALLDNDAFAQFIKNCSTDVALFRKHFLVMNALYQLHDELLSEHLKLHISALDIHIEAINNQTTHSLTTNTSFNKLSQYYLDWDNFDKTDSQQVQSLLEKFWKRYIAYDEKAQSLTILELDEQANWEEIQQKYRQLCQKHHPDKGGNAVHFLQIRQAFENLKQIYQRHNS